MERQNHKFHFSLNNKSAKVVGLSYDVVLLIKGKLFSTNEDLVWT